MAPRIPLATAGSASRQPDGRTRATLDAPIPAATEIAEGVPEGVDALSFRVFQAFTRALRSHAQLMMRILGDEGTHPGQAFCLRALARHDGMSQRDLAARLHVSRPTVTTMLQRMERSGIVRRAVDDEDKRLTRVYLTDEGRRLERSFASVLLTYSARVLDSMPADDRLELARLLDRLADNISALLADREGDARLGERDTEAPR